MWQSACRKAGTPRRRLRRGPLVASLAVVALAATACGGGAGATGSSSSGGGSGASAAASGSGGCDSDVQPYGNSDAAKAPAVTAQTKAAKLPAGTPGKGKPKVTLGTKNFPESALLGQLYAKALSAKGYHVNVDAKVGSSEVIDRAFQSGDIDFYPEYLGEIASTIAGKKPQDSAKGTYRVAKAFEHNERDATVFKQTPYQDVDVLFVKPGFCRAHHLSTIGDLARLGDGGVNVIFTAQKAARDRYEGYEGLKKGYNMPRARFYPVAVGGETLDAVSKGTANVGDAFSTTSKFVQAVRNGKFVTLDDPKHIMGFQHVAPVVKQSVAKAQGSGFEQTLNWVDAQLSLQSIHRLNKAVQLDGKSPKQVAAHFLASLPTFPST
jgi:osmoprotectant transport system substrate-binding protein